MPTPMIIQIVGHNRGENHFEPILKWLEELGLTFRNPAADAITWWNDSGDQLTTTLEDVLRKIRNSEPGNVQMWFSEGRDLFISWEKREMLIYLDGKSIEEKRMVIRAIVDNFIEIRSGLRADWKICIGNEDAIYGIE